MSATLQRIPTDFWDKWDSTRHSDGGPPPVEVTQATPRRQRSRGRRFLRACLRVLITLGIGVGGTLAWQAYGDETRQLMATAYPMQLGWIAPPAATTALAAPAESAPLASAAPAAPPVDQQQINALSLNVAAVRQTVEQLAAQVIAGQQQMSGDIARLQAAEQDILNKVSAPPPRPAPVAARKPPPPPATAAAPPPAPAAPAH
jgi:hypothetical protein